MNSPPSIIHNLKRTNSCKHSKIKVAQKYVPVINESANLAVKHFEEYIPYEKDATKLQFDRWCELASFDMFGFGARMCVGSGIAKLEYLAIICRLLQDYEISCVNNEATP